MRSCNINLVKYILSGFNVLFAISGLCILIVGTLVLVNVGEFKHFVAGKAVAPAVVLIVTGLIVFIIASLGCWGAYKESPTLLLTYALLLGVIFVVELAVGVAACFFKSNLDMVVTESLKDSMKRSGQDDLMAWNLMQQRLSCCGIENPSDWRRLSLNKTLPASCCRPQYITESIQHCSNSPALGRDKYFQDGCLLKLKQHIDKNTVILIEVALGIAFIQLLGIVLALYLALYLALIIRQEHSIHT